jgi:hypothetical protein
MSIVLNISSCVKYSGIFIIKYEYVSIDSIPIFEYNINRHNKPQKESPLHLRRPKHDARGSTYPPQRGPVV